MPVKYTAQAGLVGKRMGSHRFSQTGAFTDAAWEGLKNYHQLIAWIEDGLLSVQTGDAQTVAIATADPATGKGKPPSKDTPTDPGDQTPLVCINNGSEDDLEAVNGIGPKILKRLLQFRPYRSLEDLIDPDYTSDGKAVMTAHQLDQVRDQITCTEWVDPDADTADLADEAATGGPEVLEEV